MLVGFWVIFEKKKKIYPEWMEAWHRENNKIFSISINLCGQGFRLYNQLILGKTLLHKMPEYSITILKGCTVNFCIVTTKTCHIPTQYDHFVPNCQNEASISTLPFTVWAAVSGIILNTMKYIKRTFRKVMKGCKFKQG